MPNPTWGDVRGFCRIDEWEGVEIAGRRKRKDHFRYVKRLEDRDLRTRASHGNDRIRSKDLWKRILREQLEVSEERFWRALKTGEPVDRSPSEARAPPVQAAPAKEVWLVQALIGTVGLSEARVAQMTQEEAEERWETFCRT